MRKSLVDALLEYCENPEFCVLCGDLGFNALEPLKERLGDRFINAGIAEQNMISVAAGLAKLNMKPWIYSISPFVYARAFEQVRNDIALHKLPVRLIGSGAGYGYGMAGPTHHAIEDCAAICSLQNITLYTPNFKSDLKDIVDSVFYSKDPVYIRLGRDESPKDYLPPIFLTYRKLFNGSNSVILALGSISGSLINLRSILSEEMCPSLWTCGKLPVSFNEIPRELICEIRSKNTLIIIEDHVSVGGLGEQFIKEIVLNSIYPQSFYHLHAKKYNNELFGSQDYHRKENNIDIASVINILKKINIKLSKH